MRGWKQPITFIVGIFAAVATTWLLQYFGWVEKAKRALSSC